MRISELQQEKDELIKDRLSNSDGLLNDFIEKQKEQE